MRGQPSCLTSEAPACPTAQGHLPKSDVILCLVQMYEKSMHGAVAYGGAVVYVGAVLYIGEILYV